MAQLTAELPVSFLSGVTWFGVLQIIPTAEARRKIILQIGDAEKRLPRASILLDPFDNLSAALHGENGQYIQTPPLPATEYAGRYVALKFELFSDKLRQSTTIRLSLLGGKSVERTSEFVNSDVVHGRSSIGSDLDGSDPAVFYMSETAVYPVAPMSASDQLKLDQYFESKVSARTVDSRP